MNRTRMVLGAAVSFALATASTMAASPRAPVKAQCPNVTCYLNLEPEVPVMGCTYSAGASCSWQPLGGGWWCGDTQCQ